MWRPMPSWHQLVQRRCLQVRWPPYHTSPGDYWKGHRDTLSSRCSDAESSRASSDEAPGNRLQVPPSHEPGHLGLLGQTLHIMSCRQHTCGSQCRVGVEYPAGDWYRRRTGPTLAQNPEEHHGSPLLHVTRLIRTRWFLSVRYDSSHDNAMPCTPKRVDRVFRSLVRSSASNAAERSRYIINTPFPRSNALVTTMNDKLYFISHICNGDVCFECR